MVEVIILIFFIGTVIAGSASILGMAYIAYLVLRDLIRSNPVKTWEKMK